jgi:amino acid transporter, AAT family
MAIFLLVPALFLKFYCGNWPKKFSLPVNVLIRTGIAVVAGVLFYIFYYKTSHMFLGTQKGFSHPQQFPMIPTIWLINIWLVHHWFMDNWPAWKMVPKTVEEIAEDKKEEEKYVEDVKLTPGFAGGLGFGILAGVALYFITVWLLPVLYNAIDIIPKG